MSFEFDVFVSYPSEHAALAGRLRKELEGDGLKVWWDQRRLRPGDLLDEELGKGVRASQHLVLLVGSETSGSEYQAIELLAFPRVSEGRHLVPIQLGRERWRLLERRHEGQLKLLEARGAGLRPVLEVVREALGVGGAEAEPGKALDRYRNAVAREHGSLFPWRGGPGEMELEQFVVELAVQERGGLRRDGLSELPEELRADVEADLGEAPPPGSPDETEPGPSAPWKASLATLVGPVEGGRPRLGHLLRPGARLLVLGEPGAGKTTTFRHLAARLAGADDAPLPVFLRLADRDSTARPPQELLLAVRSPPAAGGGPRRGGARRSRRAATGGRAPRKGRRPRARRAPGPALPRRFAAGRRQGSSPGPPGAPSGAGAGRARRRRGARARCPAPGEPPGPACASPSSCRSRARRGSGLPAAPRAVPPRRRPGSRRRPGPRSPRPPPGRRSGPCRRAGGGR